jgi:predicted deacylase
MSKLTRHVLDQSGSGVTMSVTEMCFGSGSTVVYCQAALHADECPPLLVARQLCQQLAVLEAQNRLHAEFRVVTQANPIGGQQWVRQHHVGRVELGTGQNFNRDFPNVAAFVVEEIQHRLTVDPVTNRAIAREFWHEALAGLIPEHPVMALQRTLLQRAVDADWVFDLHSDDEAECHLYATPGDMAVALSLGGRLGATAVLVEADTGAQSFDDTLKQCWATLDAAFPNRGFQSPLTAMTVELRGTRDVSVALAQSDCEALLGLWSEHGLVTYDSGQLLTEPVAYPLRGVDVLTTPYCGLLVWRRSLGDLVTAGDLLAEIIEPDQPERDPRQIRARSEGRLIARRGHPWVRAGDVVCKVAGSKPLSWRFGNLIGGRQ